MTTIETIATINSETKTEINCRHKVYGEGKITNLRFTENQDKPEIMMTFESPVKNVVLAYTIVTKMKLLTFDELDTETLLNLMDEYLTNWTTYNENRKAEQLAKREAEIAKREEAKKAKADEKKAEAFEKKKEKDIRDFETMVQASNPLSLASEFYTTLGWLVKHTGTVSAALPDYLEPTFRKHFGDAPCRVVDSQKKGPAGWTSQWTSSFAVSLKKPESIPAMLEQYLNPARKALTNSEFVLDLVDNYGFRFGKTQDLEAIRSCIPSTYHNDFELGLAM